LEFVRRYNILIEIGLQTLKINRYSFPSPIVLNFFMCQMVFQNCV